MRKLFGFPSEMPAGGYAGGDGFQIVKVTRGGVLIGYRVQEMRYHDWRNVGARQPSIEAARALRALLIERRAAVREPETTETVE